MPWRFLTRLCGSPRHTPAFIEFDHMILPNTALCDRHGEHFTEGPDSLPVGSISQVVVTVPARLLSRVSNELKNTLSAGRNLAARACEARNFLVTRHAH